MPKLNYILFYFCDDLIVYKLRIQNHKALGPIPIGHEGGLGYFTQRLFHLRRVLLKYFVSHSLLFICVYLPCTLVVLGDRSISVHPVCAV